jgi:thymidine phosphorylase
LLDEGVDVVDIIRAKRDGLVLTADQIEWFIDEYATGSAIADEQAAALAMAIVWRGLTPTELDVWTQAMIQSGSQIDLSTVNRPLVDKHSTGGVGDKISLVLVPIVAACGAAVPQMSGRGLGHTGGTLDKLEAIPGWSAHLDIVRFTHQLNTIGGAIVGASNDVVPADRKLYSLRDVTGTIESIPLIASSIMSKKIAEGTRALVLDVKFGSGAFMPDETSARDLATVMVALGESAGVRTTALLTHMDTVLGKAVGNAVEVAEAIDVLSGGGPDDVRELTLALAREMLDLAGIDADPTDVLSNGAALDTFERMIEAQGGDLSRLPIGAAHTDTITAERSGWVTRMDARSVGVAAWRLGAGRSRKEDPVSAAAGLVCHAKPGDRIEAGDAIIELRTDEAERLAGGHEAIANAIDIGDHPLATVPLVAARIEAMS